MPDRHPAALPQSVHQKSAYAVARYAAIEAGKILKGRFGMHHDMQVKGKRNLVTEADLLSEKENHRHHPRGISRPRHIVGGGRLLQEGR